MSKKDLASDSIPKLFAALAIPSSVGFFFHTMYNVTDTYFAGLLGTQEIAALSISFPVFFIIIALGAGVSQGVTAIISNFLGEQNHSDANTYATQAITFSVLISIVLTIVGLIFAPFLFQLLGAEGEYLATALSYMNVVVLGSISFFLVFVFNGILTAYGDTKSYRNVLILTFLLNFIFNPLFMFGFGLIPAMGIAGVALATVVVEFIGAAYLFYRVLKTKALVHCKWSDYIPHKQVYLGIFKQGYPPSLNMMTIAIGIFIITYFLSLFSKEAVAAYGIATRIEQIFLLPSIGINTATLALIGYNNGAKRFDRVKEVYHKVIVYGLWIAVIGGTMLLLSGRWLTSIFTDDQVVISIAVQYLRIAAFLPFFYILLFSTVSALQGLKKPLYALWVGILRQIVVPVILFTLVVYVFHLGLIGIWVSIASIVVAGGIVMYSIGKYHINKLPKELLINN